MNDKLIIVTHDGLSIISEDGIQTTFESVEEAIDYRQNKKVPKLQISTYQITNGRGTYAKI